MSNYELVLVVANVTEDQELELVNEGISLLTTGRLQRAFVEASGGSVLDAVRDGVEQLEALGVRVARVHLDLVTKSEIAERTGVTKSTVGRWAKQLNGDCFPREHDWGVTGPLWAWGDVNEWLRRKGKDSYDGFCTLNREQVEEANRWLRERLLVMPTTSAGDAWEPAPAPRAEWAVAQ